MDPDILDHWIGMSGGAFIIKIIGQKLKVVVKISSCTVFAIINQFKLSLPCFFQIGMVVGVA